MARYAPLAAMLDKIGQLALFFLLACLLRLDHLSMVRAARLGQFHLALSIQQVRLSACEQIVALGGQSALPIPSHIMAGSYDSILMRAPVHKC